MPGSSNFAVCLETLGAKMESRLKGYLLTSQYFVNEVRLLDVKEAIII